MKAKVESLEVIVARAEKFFARGNFPLAKTEFENASRVEKRPEFTEKIELCKIELDKLKTRQLIKSARKLVSKNNLREAIRCFEQACAICSEDWLREKVEELKAELQGRDAGKSAQEAEAAGDYLEAAARYQQAFTRQGDENLLRRKAHCLVKAGAYDEAIALFETIPPSQPAAAYDHGFALAATARYARALQAWEGLSSKDDRFLAQREAIRSLLKADLFDRFASAPDFAAIFEEGRTFLNSGEGQAVVPQLAALMEYCRFAWIEALWEQEHFEPLAGLLLPFPEKMDSALLALYAKAFFMLAETTGRHLSEFTLFWLTAVYDRELSASLAPDAEGRALGRRELIRRAQALLVRHANAGNGVAERELTWWEKDKKLIEDLSALVGEREDLGPLVCTPRFAECFGRSVRVQQLVRDNRGFFDDTEAYLTTGSCYTTARESLYRIESGEYDAAIATLPDSNRADEFTHYGILKVHYTCGLHDLEEGVNHPARFFEASAALFEVAPRYEEELVQKALDACEFQEYDIYEEALSAIHRIRPSRRIAEALSLVMSWRAVHLYNGHKISSRSLEMILKKALKLDPANDHAKLTLGDAQAGLERMELDRAFSRRKMHKAYTIASESSHQTVRDQFFLTLEELAESLIEADFTPREKLVILDDLRGWCAKMDRAHPLLARIDGLLRQIASQRS